MERDKALAIMGFALLVIGIGITLLTAMSYAGGIISGPITSAVQSYFSGGIIAIVLLVSGGLIVSYVFFSSR